MDITQVHNESTSATAKGLDALLIRAHVARLTVSLHG
jgi:hypothetical protein